MKKSILTMLLLLMAIASFAQQRLISGQITDRDTKEAIEQVTVQLLKSDSTYVAGAISNENGLFHVTAPANGKYLLKISSVGYKSTVKRIQISDNKDLAMGKIVLGAEAIMLKGAVVTAMAQKVTLKEDTFVYNSSAYRTPEGSVVEELVKRLPGAEVSDDGTIKINGKEVKKILVDGKEFMTGDTKTALKNLPTSIIEKIKAYDEKSDLSKVTGIDDGEEQTVLDFGIKKGMNNVQQEMKDAYERQLQDKQRENDGLQSKLRKSQQENADLKALVEDCQNANAKVNGHDVYFPVNKTKIIEQERIRLNDFIASLKEQKNYKLTIIGEASSDGPSSKNFKLSEGRLNNVVDYLKKKGIEDFSIKLEKAVGDSNGCPDIKCRRVQITVE